jgi:hypothetical protein
MNPSIPLHTHYLSSASLLALPLREVPVFPPENTVRTQSLRAQPVSQIGLILSHGGGILHTGSIILRRGDYANFVIDSWNDPLVRNYGFVGEDHQALEHLIQWHPTVLEGLAVMPKRSLLSFGVAAGDDEQYHEGDFVVHLDGYIPLIRKVLTTDAMKSAETVKKSSSDSGHQEAVSLSKTNNPSPNQTNSNSTKPPNKKMYHHERVKNVNDGRK